MHLTIDARMINASGIGRYLRELLPFIVNKFKVTLLGRSEELKKFPWFNKVSVIKCRSPIYSIKEQFELPLKIPKCDIFWSPHYNIPLLPIKAKKRIVTIHDTYHLAFQSNLNLLQKSYAKFMTNKAIKLSDAIITVSNFSKSEIIKYTKTLKSINVIYNGINKNLFANKENSKENFILYVGNIKPHKNLVRALTAFSLIKGKNLQFKIIGYKETLATVDNQAIKLAQKLGRRVEFIGYVNDNTLRKLYQQAKLFLFPSLYEGFGFPPLEAMACGTPVIVSNVASLPEICGDAAFYVNPYDVNDIARGMETVLKDENLQKELIQKGLERVKLFSWKISAEKLLKIMENLV